MLKIQVALDEIAFATTWNTRFDNGRRQRVLKGRSPDVVLRERLKAKPELAKPVTKLPDPDALPKALKVVARAKEVSHPDTLPGFQPRYSDGLLDDVTGVPNTGPLEVGRSSLRMMVSEVNGVRFGPARSITEERP